MDKIKIGGHVFDLEFVKGDIIPTNDGDISWKYNKIRISTETSVSNQKVTLLHEIIHAISSMYNLKLSEQSVQIISENLLQVIVDNKMMMDWITE